MSEAIFVEGLTRTDVGKPWSISGTTLPIGVMLGVAALCTILAVCFFRWE